MSFNYNEVKRLREERRVAHEQAIAILAKRGNITDEDRQRFDRAMKDVNGLGARIAAAEGGLAPAYEGNSARELAFGRFIRQGVANLDAAEKRMLESRDINEGGNQLAHLGTYSGLGFFVPTGFRAVIEQATKYFCPFSDPDVSGVTVMETDSGNAIPMPTSNDTNQQATIVGEAAAVSEQDIVASSIDISAYKLSSGLIKASIELLQDSAFDIEAWLGQRFGERFGRGLEYYLTLGTGNPEPTGILTAVEASGVSPVISVGSSANDGIGTAQTSIGSIDMVNLEHGVDPSYRRGARYMFHDSTLQSLQRLLDKFGRPLWLPGMAVNAPATVNGYPYVVNQQMPALAAGNNAVLFGDFSKFVVRKVKALSVQRLEELYAVTGQVGFISFARVDSVLLDAGTHPINLLEQHS